MKQILSRSAADLSALLPALEAMEPQLTRLGEALLRTWDNNGKALIAGNGGSAATATHWVNDLGKATKASGRPWLRVLCLSDNVSWLTALGNDEGYDRVFAGQLENFVRPGDLLAVISASGNSPNLVNVVDYANAHGVQTVALLGFDGGVLKDRVDEHLWLETPIGLYGPVESGHSVLCDILTTCLTQDSIRESTRVAQRQSA
jgi:D-sedoheptulose 7-phosphate isomerase